MYKKCFTNKPKSTQAVDSVSSYTDKSSTALVTVCGRVWKKTRITVLRTEQAKKEKADRGASVMGVRSMKYKACSRDMHME